MSNDKHEKEASSQNKKEVNGVIKEHEYTNSDR